MATRRTVAARTAAVLALIAGFLALAYIVTASVSSDSDPGRDGRPAATKRDGKKKGGKAKPPEVYVVEPGDSLDAIAGKTGVDVERLEELNPQLDPQLLSPGQRVKLR